MKTNKKQFLLFGNFFIGFFLVFAFINIDISSVFAGIQNSARGFGWGGSETNSDGVMNNNESGPGWISFNSLDCDSDNNGYKDSACGGGGFAQSYNYGVNIPSVDGNLSGYAWSDNVGWISFNSTDVAGCPIGDCSAKRVGNTIVGWARILALRSTGSFSGHLDGFLSLNTKNLTSIPYGVSITGNTLAGYAWSGIGWIDFSGVSIDNNMLKICQGSCTSGVRRDTGYVSTFALPRGSSVNLFACMGTGSCNGDDVSVSATWSEISTSPYSDAVDKSPVDNPQTNVWIEGKNVGSEKINASKDSYSADAVAQVICVDTAGVCDDMSADAKNTCSGKQYTLNYTDSCTGIGSSKQCDGQRYCDFNWKETPPSF